MAPAQAPNTPGPEGVALIKVAHLGPDPRNEGGMAAVLRDLVASPLGERHELEVIPTWRESAPVARLGTFAVALLRLAVWCLKPGRRIVHVHTAVRGSLYRKSLCILVAKAARRPVLVQLHAGPGDIQDFAARIGGLRRRILGASLRRADRVVSVSSTGAGAIARCFRVADVAVVPNAAPTVPAQAQDVGRGTGEHVTILYVGGFENTAKGGSVLVSALPDLVAALPAATVTLAGPGEPLPALLEYARRSPNLSWIGWLDAAAKREAFGSCDIFVMPSLSEGLPVALLEAMAWGTAVVAARVGGVPDVLTDGEDAALVDPGRPDQLVAAITALAGNGEERRRLGHAARRRAAELNEHEVCDRLDAIYRELAA